MILLGHAQLMELSIAIDLLRKYDIIRPWINKYDIISISRRRCCRKREEIGAYAEV